MKNKSMMLCLCSLFLTLSCSHSQPKSFQESSGFKHFKMSNPAPIVGKTVSGQDIYLGGFSGLSFIQSKGGSDYFYAITDRGPNGWNEGIDRPFLLPEFSPQIITLKTNPEKSTLEVVSQLQLKKKNGSPLSGLPNQRNEENPTDLYGFMYSIDGFGLDTEALTSDNEGGFWVADEYGPSLVHFNSKGEMVRRLMAGNELPKLYLERKLNRGFEGISLVENRLFGFLQSPLPKEENFSRIVEVDLLNMKTTAEYYYPFEKGNDKVGDAVSIGNNSFLVIEQNGKTGDKSSKLIFKITLGENDKNVQKTLIADLKSTPFNNLEKVEGLTVLNDHQIALCNDNDFQIAAKTDHQTGITPLSEAPNELLILDLKESLKENLR